MISIFNFDKIEQNPITKKKNVDRKSSIQNKFKQKNNTYSQSFFWENRNRRQHFTWAWVIFIFSELHCFCSTHSQLRQITVNHSKLHQSRETDVWQAPRVQTHTLESEDHQHWKQTPNAPDSPPEPLPGFITLRPGSPSLGRTGALQHTLESFRRLSSRIWGPH